MKESVFRFKQFSVEHSHSSMKVGVDAVLLGAWAGVKSGKILDVGTGCGVISLILAQRFSKAEIIGIDIDSPSVNEATFNFSNSPWNNRMSAMHLSFPEGLIENKFDLIVSNPPYFNSGISSPTTQREKARHQQSLSVFSLINKAPEFLTSNGRLSMIYPADFRETVGIKAKENGLYLLRECEIKGNENRPVKRVMSEFGLEDKGTPFLTSLTLYQKGEPTQEYKDLCKDLYLKF